MVWTIISMPYRSSFHWIFVRAFILFLMLCYGGLISALASDIGSDFPEKFVMSDSVVFFNGIFYTFAPKNRIAMKTK